MQIPYEFSLFGMTIRVEWDDTLVDVDDSQGTANYRQNKIVLQDFNGKNYRTRDKEWVNVTFLHELFHFIFNVMGKQELNEDENFIKLLSALFYQYLVTAKYKPDIVSDFPKKDGELSYPGKITKVKD